MLMRALYKELQLLALQTLMVLGNILRTMVSHGLLSMLSLLILLYYLDLLILFDLIPMVQMRVQVQ